MTAAVSTVLARRKGSIVNVASARALTACELAPAYSISKAIVVGLTRTYARSLANLGIRVNAVAPGDIETDMSPGSANSEAMRVLIAAPPSNAWESRERSQISSPFSFRPLPPQFLVRSFPLMVDF